MSRARSSLPVFLLALVAVLLPACGGLYQKNLEGEAPPPFESNGSMWINSDPLTLKELRGKVVYLEFGFHG